MIPPVDEAELKAMTRMMYKAGGIGNVLNCIDTMAKCQQIILAKLVEILSEDERASNV
jgi:hypothetical protein